MVEVLIEETIVIYGGFRTSTKDITSWEWMKQRFIDHTYESFIIKEIRKSVSENEVFDAIFLAK